MCNRPPYFWIGKLEKNIINLTFKGAFKWLYNQWMTTTKRELTPSSRMRYMSLVTVCKWILAAWRSVSPETVDKSFKVTVISNDMDSHEDFIINEFYEALYEHAALNDADNLLRTSKVRAIR